MKLTYSSLGNLLLQLREIKGLSQSEVGKGVGVKSNFISKLERGERNTTPQIVSKLSQFYGVNESQLLNIYHSELILQQLDTLKDIKSVLKLVRLRRKTPSLQFELPQSIFGYRSSKTILEDRRKYVKGGRFGKVKGLNLYLRKNGKLTKKDRDTLFRKGENYIGEVFERLSVSQSIEEIMLSVDNLDPGLSDLENVSIWNSFYDQYYGFFPEFVEIELRGQDYFGDPKDENEEDDNWGMKKITLQDLLRMKRESESTEG